MFLHAPGYCLLPPKLDVITLTTNKNILQLAAAKSEEWCLFTHICSTTTHTFHDKRISYKYFSYPPGSKSYLLDMENSHSNKISFPPFFSCCTPDSTDHYIKRMEVPILEQRKDRALIVWISFLFQIISNKQRADEMKY